MELWSAVTTIFKKDKKAIIIGISLIISAFFLIQWWSKPVSVMTYSVQKQDYVPSLLISGEVIPEFSTVLSTQTAGTVLQSLVKKGDIVKQGELILQIDDRQAQVALDRADRAVQMARAKLLQASTVTVDGLRLSSIEAEIGLEQAQLEYERTQTLAQAGAVSQQEMKQAEQHLKLAQERSRSASVSMEALQNDGVSLAILQVELEQRLLDLKENQLLLENFKVVAPLDGEIMELYAKPGELLQAASKVALVSSSQRSRIRIIPDQRYATLAAIDLRAEVWIPSDVDVKWPAQVEYTDPSGNADQGSLTVELSLEQNVPTLYPGQLVSVQLYGPLEKQALIITDNYLTVQEGKSGVWLAQDNRAHFTELQTGLRTPEGILILAGLKEGDLVLSPEGLLEGQLVEPQIEGMQQNEK